MWLVRLECWCLVFDGGLVSIVMGSQLVDLGTCVWLHWSGVHYLLGVDAMVIFL